MKMETDTTDGGPQQGGYQQGGYGGEQGGKSGSLPCDCV